MSLDHFVYDGVDSRDFGIYLFDLDTFGASAREYESLDVPGKSGGVLIDGKRYPNRVHAYSCIIKDDAVRNLDAFRAFLLSRQGYCRLEDSIHLDEFYNAVFREEFSPILSTDRKMAKFELMFERKPQRWLKSGENAVTMSGSDLSGDGVSILNPTRFPAYPLIVATGGTNVIMWGDTRITVHAPSNTSTYIDCELMEAYYADASTGEPTESRNYNVEFSDYEFPTLPPGEIVVKYLDSSASSLTIRPRWYTM